MKEYFKYIFIILIIIHGYFLYSYGITTFISTCLFYYFIYWLLCKLTSLIKTEKRKATLLKNIKYTFLAMLSIEFIMYFFFVFSIQSGIRKIVSFSENKKKEQIALLNKFELKKINFTYTEAYIHNSKRLISVKNYSIFHSYNQLGLRGKLPLINKDSNEYRIIILGDSFVEGDGTSEDSTISVLLENKIKTIIPNYKFTIINGGISGSNPIYEIQLYRKLLSNYKPNLIILSVFNNDLSDIKTMNSLDNKNFNESICSISVIYRLFYYLFFSFENFDNKHVPKNILSQRNKITNELVDSIQNFKLQLEKENIKLVTMYIPTQDEVRFSEYNNVVGNLMNYDVNLFNVFKKIPIEKEQFTNEYYWQTDAHFKPKGYNLVAEIIAQYLIDKNYVRTL